MGNTIMVENPITFIVDGKPLPSANFSDKYSVSDPTRYKSQIIAGFQSASVDNAKEQILNKLNINNTTFNAFSALNQLGWEEKYSVGIMAQDVMFDLVSEIENLKDSIEGTFTEDRIGTARTTMLEKYFPIEEFESAEAFEKWKKDLDANPHLSAEELERAILEGPDYGEYKKVQYLAMNYFMQANEIGESLRNVKYAINTDSNHLGKSFIETQHKEDAAKALSTNSHIGNADALLGEVVMDETGKLILMPSTNTGYATVDGVFTANSLFGNLFPYQAGGVDLVTKEILELAGVRESSMTRFFETKRKVFTGIKSYLWSKQEIGLISDATHAEERQRLMFDKSELQTAGSTVKFWKGDKITSLEPNQVFVFGSNPEGRHGKGSALAAKGFGLPMYEQSSDNVLAIMTKDLGPAYFKGDSPFKLQKDSQGDSYYYSNNYNFYKDKVINMTTGESFPKDPKSGMFNGNWNMKMPRQVVVEQIESFYNAADLDSRSEFLVADYSGKNLNGYTGKEMAAIFKEADKAPNNVKFSYDFAKLMGSTAAKETRVHTHKSVASRLHAFSKTVPGKRNPLVRLLTTEIDLNGKKPSTIEFNAAAGENMDESLLHSALIELLNSDNDETVLLARQDLINYAVLNGFTQGASNFVKFISPAYLKAMGVNEAFREFDVQLGKGDIFGASDSSTDPNYISRFAKQFIQHNPDLAPKLGIEHVPNGKKSLPAEFTLKLKEELSYMIKPTSTHTTYKKIIAVYDDKAPKKYRLYENVGMASEDTVIFKQIDTLGYTKGVTEYSPELSEAGSLIDGNKAKLSKAKPTKKNIT